MVWYVTVMFPVAKQLSKCCSVSKQFADEYRSSFRVITSVNIVTEKDYNVNIPVCCVQRHVDTFYTSIPYRHTVRLTAINSPNCANRITTSHTNSVAPEPEGSSPHSQQPANGPYPEPRESTPHPPKQSP
jgi:hypothetical protein